MHADPSELVLKDGDVWHEGQRVDLAYRDYGVVDLLELEAEGVDVEPMRVLLRENRMVSSIAAELDQKACWEVLTDPRLCQEYFTAGGAAALSAAHPVDPRAERPPDGAARRAAGQPARVRADEPRSARAQAEPLVRRRRHRDRPGGHPRRMGDRRCTAALADPDDRWVVQQLATIPVREFPVVAPDGTVHIEPFYTVMGFAANEDGVAILARASQKQVVNVAQHGGICGVLVSRSRPAVAPA